MYFLHLLLTFSPQNDVMVNGPLVKHPQFLAHELQASMHGRLKMTNTVCEPYLYIMCIVITINGPSLIYTCIVCACGMCIQDCSELWFRKLMDSGLPFQASDPCARYAYSYLTEVKVRM